MPDESTVSTGSTEPTTTTKPAEILDKNPDIGVAEKKQQEQREKAEKAEQ
jgi:hypothetical protein